MTPDRIFCPGHQEFKELVEAWLEKVEGYLKNKIDHIEAQMSDIKSEVHELRGEMVHHKDRLDDIHGRVEHMRGIVGGFHKRADDLPTEPIHTTRRETDTLIGRIKDNWLFIIVIILASLAGEKALTETKEIIMEMVHHSSDNADIGHPVK